MKEKVRSIISIAVTILLLSGCAASFTGQSTGLSIKRETFTFKEFELQNLSPEMFVDGAANIIRDARFDIIVDEGIGASKQYDSDASLIAVEGLEPGEYEGVITSGSREVTFRVIVV